jgi:hypothetical protein
VDLSLVADVNTCYRSSPPPIDEMRRLRDELTITVRGPADIQTLRWIWRCPGTPTRHCLLGAELLKCH